MVRTIILSFTLLGISAFFVYCGSSGTRGSLKLDTGFGSNGFVTTDIGSDDVGQAVAVGSDGSIYVGGATTSTSGTTDQFVSKYSSSGTLDTAFNSVGYITTDFSSGTEEVAGIGLQSSGKIIVVGTNTVGGASYIIASRFNTNGTLDSDFATSGKFSRQIGPTVNIAKALVITSQDKIVIAGYSTIAGKNQFFAIRLTSAGVLDTTFGSSGVFNTSIVNIDDQANSMTMQSDGKFILAGTAKANTTSGGVVTTTNNFAAIRITSDGALDTNFGTSGKYTVDIGHSSATGSPSTSTPTEDFVNSVILNASSSPVLIGRSNAATRDDIALIKLSTIGAMDTSFGSNGYVVQSFNESGSSTKQNTYGARSILANGAFVTVGYLQGASANKTAIFRFSDQGALDTNVGTGGISLDFNGEYYHLALGASSKVVVVGRSRTSSGNDILISQYSL